MRTTSSMWGAVLTGVLAAGAGTAGAQEAAEGSDGAVVEERQMTLPAGHVFVQGFFEVNLSRDAAFEPVSVAPDVWYGVSDILAVGLIHSGRGATGVYGGVGNGICFTGEDGGCAKLYDNVGITARYHVYREGDVTAAAEGGLFVQSFDPFTMALKLGAVGRWQHGALAVDASPSVFVGLNERGDGDGTVVITSSNKETVVVPVSALYVLSADIGVAVQVAGTVPVADAADLFTVGFSLGGQYMVSNQISVDAAFSLPMIVAGDALSDFAGADARTITLGVNYAH